MSNPNRTCLSLLLSAIEPFQKIINQKKFDKDKDKDKAGKVNEA
jgi:hypothetical protein